MAKYIFLDNWVLSRLVDVEFAVRLSNFIRKRGYVILITRELMAELYNPKWRDVGNRDRGFVVANFIGAHPSVIIHPIKVFEAEYLHFPKNINTIPVELDLITIKDEFRAQALLGVLRRDTLLLEQGIDIEKWSNDLKTLKSTWLDDIRRIINDALQNGMLKQNEKGDFIVDIASKEIALTSLDLRLLNNPDVGSFLRKASLRKNRTGKISHLRGARIISLCHWYSSIEIDKTNRLKQQGSDIVDYYHLGLMPYCSAFTLDTNMSRLLEYVAKDIDISRCDLFTPKTLDDAITRY